MRKIISFKQLKNCEFNGKSKISSENVSRKIGYWIEG
jgi:hypothetical protein